MVTSPELSDAVASVDVDVSASAEEVDSEAGTEAVVTSNPASSAADAAEASAAASTPGGETVMFKSFTKPVSISYLFSSFIFSIFRKRRVGEGVVY